MKLTSTGTVFLLGSILAWAFECAPVSAEAVSEQELARVEKEVELQNIKHRKLQAQANQINMELTMVSQEMVKAARQIQNNEEKLSKMEKQLELLKENLQKAEETFASEDENLIKTLSALQNLALKPTEALFVQLSLIHI